MEAGIGKLLDLDVPHVVVESLNDTELSPEVRHHLFKVRRLRAGAKMTVTDGKGAWQQCVLGKESLELINVREYGNERKAKVQVCIALTKSGKPELITQKLTELGVNSIKFFLADRSVPQWNEKKLTKNTKKLRMVAKMALAQSKGVWLPELSLDSKFEHVIGIADMSMADRRGEPLPSSVHKIMIGPEGGWSKTEYSCSLPKFSIHELNLRSETAAIAAAVKLIGNL
ncbi:MAG: RsmE family RNA methyltransferase [Actinomycetota bacterium]|nr:RsmE family RNA methyltransferase [Actinomycetota bacterium]